MSKLGRQKWNKCHWWHRTTDSPFRRNFGSTWRTPPEALDCESQRRLERVDPTGQPSSSQTSRWGSSVEILARRLKKLWWRTHDAIVGNMTNGGFLLASLDSLSYTSWTSVSLATQQLCPSAKPICKIVPPQLDKRAVLAILIGEIVSLSWYGISWRCVTKSAGDNEQ